MIVRALLTPTFRGQVSKPYFSQEKLPYPGATDARIERKETTITMIPVFLYVPYIQIIV